MANLEIRDGAGLEKFIKATGAGTDGDPFVSTQALAANDGVDIGNVDVATVAIPSAIFSGQQTIGAAGTAEVIGATQALLSGVTVKALAGNAGLVYVGNSGVSAATGFELAAGEQIFIECDDVATVFIDAATTGDGISWVGS